MTTLASDAFHPLALEDWRGWLSANHRTSTGVWLVTYKKATGKPRIEYDDAVSEALCWGWIDSVTRVAETARLAQENVRANLWKKKEVQP